MTQKVTKKDFTLLGKILLTVIEISGFVSIFLISNIKGANGKYEFLMLLMISILPQLIFFFVFQKQITNSQTTSGLKD